MQNSAYIASGYSSIWIESAGNSASKDDYRHSHGLDMILGAYRYLCKLDKSAAVMALSRAAADSERSGFIRAIAAMALCQESRSEGLHALHELSRDQKAIGFHRVFHFAMIAVEDERATRLSALSNDPTLPGVWRIFRQPKSSLNTGARKALMLFERYNTILR